MSSGAGKSVSSPVRVGLIGAGGIGSFHGESLARRVPGAVLASVADLGVKQAAVVLRYIVKTREQGIGVIFITHNVHHAFPVADRFTILRRGQSYGNFAKSEVTREEVASMMAGGEDMETLSAELAEFERTDAEQAGSDDATPESTEGPGPTGETQEEERP